MEQIFGVMGAFFGISSLIPQAFKSYKTKKTRDLSRNTFLFIAIGNTCWMIHGYIRHDMILFVANAIAVSFAVYIVAAKRRYG